MQHHRTMTPSVAIVIPVYKPAMMNMERLAFQQCFRILHRHPIHLVTFAGLDLSAYREYGGDFTVDIFEQEYFTGIASYNRLMMSYDFYYRFKAYEYILLYQLDAYVFRDELSEWCRKGYDYIGAPWFANHEGPSKHGFSQGGNGGLSLRHIPHFLTMLETANRFKLLKDYGKLCLKDKIGSFGRMFLRFLHPRFTPDIAQKYDRFEDIFWTLFINRKIKRLLKGTWYRDYLPERIYPQLRIAPFEEALRFSFECRPSHLYRLNQQQLPFGCHAWDKYEPEFWAKFIPMSQYDTSKVDAYVNT